MSHSESSSDQWQMSPFINVTNVPMAPEGRKQFPDP